MITYVNVANKNSYLNNNLSESSNTIMLRKLNERLPSINSINESSEHALKLSYGNRTEIVFILRAYTDINTKLKAIDVTRTDRERWPTGTRVQLVTITDSESADSGSGAVSDVNADTIEEIETSISSLESADTGLLSSISDLSDSIDTIEESVSDIEDGTKILQNSHRRIATFFNEQGNGTYTTTIVLEPSTLIHQVAALPMNPWNGPAAADMVLSISSNDDTPLVIVDGVSAGEGYIASLLSDPSPDEPLQSTATALNITIVVTNNDVPGSGIFLVLVDFDRIGITYADFEAA